MRRRHRRRRLVLGREPVGPGALHGPLQRGGRARHGVDLERDRQGRRRLAARARRRRGAEGLPAEPPDLARTCRSTAPAGAAVASATPTRSPARPAGTTCACASARPRPTRRPSARRRRRPGSPIRHCCALGVRPSPADSAAGAKAIAMIRWLKDLLASHAVADGAGGAVAEPPLRDRARCARASSAAPGRGLDRRRSRDAREPARARHRPQRLRRLPRLRDLVQGMEHRRQRRSAVRRERLRREPDRHLLQPRADLRGRHLSRHRDDPLPEELPALRGPAVRAGLPDRRELQAQVRRHRAGRLRQVHRLQVLRMGLPVRRARARRRAPGDDQVHACASTASTTSRWRRPIASRPA